MMTDETKRVLPRRTVTTALSWSVPVIGMIAAAPLAAASTPVAVSFTMPEDITDAAIGDSLPLVFFVDADGAPVTSGYVTVVLADTVAAEFDPNQDGYAGPTVANVAIEGGVALAIILVKAFGTVDGTITYGTSTSSFSVGVRGA